MLLNPMDAIYHSRLADVRRNAAWMLDLSMVNVMFSLFVDLLDDRWSGQFAEGAQALRPLA